MILPAHIEKRLLDLEKELNDAQSDLVEAEAAYNRSKTEYELGMARTRLGLAGSGVKMTVQDREDTALTQNEKHYRAMMSDEAWVRGSRANVNRVRSQVDITRSLGASVRSAMEM
jgi:hypothetical protein